MSDSKEKSALEPSFPVQRYDSSSRMANRLEWRNDSDCKGQSEPPPPYSESPPKNEQKRRNHVGKSRFFGRMIEMIQRGFRSQVSGPGTFHPYPNLVKFEQYRGQKKLTGFVAFTLHHILAKTFHMDIPKYKAACIKLKPLFKIYFAMYTDDSKFMDDRILQMSLELCSLVRHLKEHRAHSQWPFRSGMAGRLAETYILEPAMKLQIDLVYFLEILGEFEQAENSTTLVDHWTRKAVATHNTTYVGDTLASHALFFHSMKVHPLTAEHLQDSLVAFKRDRGWQDLETSKAFQQEALRPESCSCWPLRDDYIELACVLRALKLDYEDRFEASRRRLIENQLTEGQTVRGRRNTA